MKKQFIMGLAIFAVLVLAGCNKGNETIKIGVAGAHSGDLASYGLPSSKAAILVVEKANANGGILGKQVELLIEDDQCKPEMATNAASKLVGDGVVAVMGHICSGATKAALGIYKDEEIITMSPSATTPELTKSGDYPNFFRTIASDDAQAEVEVNYIAEVLGLKKLALIHDKTDYGKGFATFCRDMLEARGIEVVLFEGIQVGDVDYSAIINKVANSPADGVIFGGYHPEASKLVSQMRKKNLELPFLSDDGAKDPQFIKVAGEYAEGVYATGPVDTSSNAMAIEAIKEHKEKYGEEPGAYFLNAYVATTAILNAIEEAGSTDYEAVRKALQSKYVDTPFGKIKFDEKGDAIGVGYAMYQVENGEFTEVK